MKERIYRIAALILYFWALGYLAGFSPHAMLDVRGMAAVFLGLLLLSLPQVYDRMRKQQKRDGAVGNIIARNGMMSGYLTGILFLTTHLLETGRVDDIPRLLGADLRPVLYGLCIYTIFSAKEAERTSEEHADGAAEKGPTNEELYVYYQKSGLTNRETELAILAYRGYSNREIAEVCYISEATVKKHMTHIFEKLGIDRREELQNRGVDNECNTKTL